MAATLTATWDEGESRVRLALTGAGTATWATFYSRREGTNTFEVVRGAWQVPVASGTARAVFDYEFYVNTTPPLVLSEGLLLGEDVLLGGLTITEYKVVTSTAEVATATEAPDVQGRCWLKFPAYPYRNRQVTVVGRSSISRSSRGSLVPIVAGGAPAAVQEVMGSREFDVTLRTASWAEYKALDLAISLGSIVFLHGDEIQLGLPSCYAIVQSIDSAPVGRQHGQARATTLRVVEVAKPHYLYAGVLGTVATVLANYTTVADLLAAYDTCAELLEIEGTAEDVIVT